MSDRARDPELEQAIRFARQMSRRRFMVRGGLGLGGLLRAPSLLTACGDDDGGGDEAAAGNGSTAVTFSNWDAYIDEDDDGNVDGPGTTIADFEKSTGIQMTYRKDFNDNDEYFNKIYSPLLGKGKRIDADITGPSSWMAARIIGLGWTEPLPLDEIPNHKNLEDVYLNLDWDKGAKHFMPWQAGIAGVAYNPKLVGGDLTSMNDLYDPKLKGKVAMLTEWRDSVGLTMMGEGDDIEKPAMDAINKALDKIEKAKSDGQVLKFTGNEYLRSLENGDISACVAWSGDILQLDPELGIKFVIPEEGGTNWFDTMVISKGTPNLIAAARWMNYVYDPENAAKITAWVQYISPVKGVKDALIAQGDEGKELAESPLLFPDEDTLAKTHVFGELSQDDDIAVQTRFNEITG